MSTLERMTQRDWALLSDEIGLAVWRMECADVMIPRDEADRRWQSFPMVGSNRRIEITHLVGCALIALEERGLLKTAAKGGGK